MSTKKKRTKILNERTKKHYFDRLLELSISMFEWKNLPEGLDFRFLEYVLFSDGVCIFFKDKDLSDEEYGGFIAGRMVNMGTLNLYHIPEKRACYGINGYYRDDLDYKNSVVIYNNLIRQPASIDIEIYAEKLANIDRTIDTNLNAQKTPVVIMANEKQRMTMINLYSQYDGNEPFIFTEKNLDLNQIKTLDLKAPYLIDQLQQAKNVVWNEALTYLGISNTNMQKKERMLQDEVKRNLGGVIASRYSRLEARRQACKQINKLFNLDIWVDYREDYQLISDGEDTINGNPNSDGEGGNIDE